MRSPRANKVPVASGVTCTPTTGSSSWALDVCAEPWVSSVAPHKPTIRPHITEWRSVTGRSGSTTILSMLNRLPGVELDGEHNGESSPLSLSMPSGPNSTPTPSDQLSTSEITCSACSMWAGMPP
eukprot:1879989-Pyramimonas_sp.AAC.1